MYKVVNDVVKVREKMNIIKWKSNKVNKFIIDKNNFFNRRD